MSTKNRKHSGRKRPAGELKMLNLRKFEKMVAISVLEGWNVTEHPDPRYYPKIIPVKPVSMQVVRKNRAATDKKAPGAKK